METYNISFSGETLPGCHPDAARKRLAKYFHLDTDNTIERFFTGEKVILKRNLDRDTAVGTYQDLRRLGIVVAIEKADPQEAAEALRKEKRQREAARQQQTDEARQAARQQQVQQRREQAEREAAKQRAIKARANRQGAEPGATPGKHKTAPASTKPTDQPRGARKPGAQKQAAPPKTQTTRPAAKKSAQSTAKRPAPKAPTPTPGARGAVAGTRRKRQPGAPNLFDVRLSEGALKEAEAQEEHFSGAPLLGAAILLVAFVLVGLRFWMDSFETPPAGLGAVTVDSAGRPAVVVNDQLLRHDRAGNPGELMPLSDIGLAPTTPIAFLGDGKLLLQQGAQGQDMPAWLRDFLDIEAKPGRLQRCSTRKTSCAPFLQPLDAGSFALNRDGGYVVIADVLGNRLLKYDTDGKALASRPIAMTSPVHLAVRDGVLFLSQGNSDVVKALVTDNGTFGEELGLYTLAVAGAQATGHIFPGALEWLEQHWWVVMQSRDSSTAGLYRFDANWQAVDAVPLPEGASPGQPAAWGEKLLVPDALNDTVYRVAADNTLEAPFSVEPISAALTERRTALDQSASLQAVVMLMLFFAALGLFTFGSVKSLQGKIYRALNDTDEQAFDIENDAIRWLDPGRDARVLIKRGGFLLAGLTFLVLATAVLLKPGLGVTVATLLVLAGIAGYGYAIYQSWGCHLGRLGDQLVVVDHKSTYRVGRGPRIQYVNNYVMIDDVIVYLGNALLPQFSHEPLQQDFEPVVTRGIKVDRTTLRLKLINSRHPMFYGGAGLAFSLAAALLILLLA